MDIAAQLEQIESKLAHLEHTVAALNDVVTRQQRELSQLQATEQLLSQQLQSLESAAQARGGGFEIPPHY